MATSNRSMLRLIRVGADHLVVRCTLIAITAMAISTWSSAARAQTGAKAAREHLEKGVDFLRRRAYESAVEQFTAALDADPDGVIALRYRATAYLYDGLTSRALADAEAYVEKRPDDPDGLLVRGNARRSSGDREAAIADFGRALDLRPDDAHTLDARGQTYRDTGDFNSARKDFDRAIEVNEKFVLSFIHRARLRCEAGDYRGALADAEQAIELAPRDARGYAERALARLELGEYQEAIEDSDQAVRLNGRLAEPIAVRGLAKAYEGEIEAGLEDCHAALRIAPDDGMIYVLRGRLMAAMGEGNAAAEDYFAALEHDSRLLPAMRARAELYMAYEQPDDAIKDANRLVQMAGGSAANYALRAWVHQYLGDSAAMVKDCERALELDAKNVGAMELLAEHHLLNGSYHASETYCDRILAIDDEHSTSYAVWGLCQLARIGFDDELGDSFFRSVETRFARAIELSPEFSVAYCGRGACRAALGDVEGGLADCARGFEISDSLSLNYSLRALVHIFAGDGASCRRDLEQALTLDPTSVLATVQSCVILRIGEEHQTAIDLLTRGMQYHPNAAILYVKRAQCHASLGASTLAERDLARAIQIDDPQTTPHAHLIRSMFRGASENLAGALEDVEKAIELSGEDAPTLFHAWRANIRAVNRDLAGAKADIEKAGVADEGFTWTRSLLESAQTQIAINVMDFEGALRHNEAALKLSPSYVHLHQLNAQLLGTMGRTKEAVAALDEAIRLAPGQIALYDERAKLHLLNEDFVLAEVDCEKMIELMPTMDMGHLLLSEALLRQKKYDAANDAVKQALRRNSKNPVAFYQLSRLANLNGDQDIAEGHLDRVLEEFPKLEFVRMERARLRLETGRYAEALEDVDLALQVRPDAEPFHGMRAALLLLLRRDAEARRAIRQIEIMGDQNHLVAELKEYLAIDGDRSGLLKGIDNPRDRTAFVLANPFGIIGSSGKPKEGAEALGKTPVTEDAVKEADEYSSQGWDHLNNDRVTEAESAFRVAIKLNPKLATAYVGLAEVQRDAGDVKSASESARRALELDDANGRAHALLAHCSVETGDYDQALASAIRTVELGTNDDLTRIIRASVMLDLYQYRESLAELTGAINDGTTEATIFELRAKLYEGMGLYGAAVEDLDRVLEIDPDHAYALETRPRLWLMIDHVLPTMDELEQLDFLAAVQPNLKDVMEVKVAAATRLRRTGKSGQVDTQHVLDEAAAQYVDRGEKSLRNQMPLAAEVNFRRALRYASSSETVRLSLAEALVRQKKTDEAKELVRFVVRHFDATDEILERLKEIAKSAEAAEVGEGDYDWEGLLPEIASRTNSPTRSVTTDDSRQATGSAERGAGRTSPFADMEEGEGAEESVTRSNPGRTGDAVDRTPVPPSEAMEDVASLARRRETGERDLADAIEKAKRADDAATIVRSPDDLDAWIEEVRDAIRERHFETAMKELQEILIVAGERADAWHLRGLAFANLQNGQQAKVDFDEAIRLDPDEAQYYFDRARLLLAARPTAANYSKAFRDLEKALELNPEHVASLVQRALGQQRLKNYRAALADYTRALRIEPTNLMALGNRGYLYYSQGEYQKAIRDFDTATEQETSGDHAIYANRGLVYSRMKRWDQAIADFSKAIERSTINSARYYSLRAGSYVQVRDYERAVSDYGEAMRLAPQEMKYVHQRALLYLVLEDYANAMADIQRGLATAPQDATYLYLRGLCHARQESWKEAEMDLSRAIAMNPRMSAAYMTRADVYEALGENAQAAKDRDAGQRIQRGAQSGLETLAALAANASEGESSAAVEEEGEPTGELSSEPALAP